MSAILPVILITGVLMEMFSAKYTGMSRQYVAESGSFAEQVLSSVRTVKACGSQKMLADAYAGFTQKILHNESWAAAVIGVGTGIFFFIIYAGYALGELQ
jgi:ATP-binding cassette subfamily B (MDR/TAP) protein 1